MSRAASLTTPLRCIATHQERIVAIGGGSGLPTVLKGLRAAFGLDHPAGSGRDQYDRLTAIVTVTDDGGSSGRLRREFGMLPPGDVRNCLAALAPEDSPIASLMQHRFEGAGDLAGHTIGNLILAALTQMTGDFQAAVEKLSSLLDLRGTVLPSTAESVALKAHFASGETVKGETAIVSSGRSIKRLTLERPVRPLPEAVRALVNADAIVIGPGSLFTSVLPNLLVDGIASTLSGVGGVRIYVANLMTQPGETEGMSLEAHLAAIQDHAGPNVIDYVLVNSRPIPRDAIARYESQGSAPVVRTGEPIENCQIVERDMAWQVDGGKIRHDPADLAAAILDLVRIGRPQTSGARALPLLGRAAPMSTRQPAHLGASQEILAS